MTKRLRKTQNLNLSAPALPAYRRRKQPAQGAQCLRQVPALPWRALKTSLDAGLMKELKIRLMERMPGGGLTAHPGCEDGKEAPSGQGNCLSGTAAKG